MVDNYLSEGLAFVLCSRSRSEGMNGCVMIESLWMSGKCWFWCLSLGYSPLPAVQMFCRLPVNSFLNTGLASNPYSKCFVWFLWALFCRQELLKNTRKLNFLYFGLLLCQAHTCRSALGRGSEVDSSSQAGDKVVKADARPLEPRKACPGACSYLLPEKEEEQPQGQLRSVCVFRES